MCRIDVINALVSVRHEAEKTTLDYADQAGGELFQLANDLGMAEVWVKGSCGTGIYDHLWRASALEALENAVLKAGEVATRIPDVLRLVEQISRLHSALLSDWPPCPHGGQNLL